MVELLKGERIGYGTIKALGFKMLKKNSERVVFSNGRITVKMSKPKRQIPKILSVDGGDIFYHRNSRPFKGGGKDYQGDKQRLRWLSTLQETDIHNI